MAPVNENGNKKQRILLSAFFWEKINESSLFFLSSSKKNSIFWFHLGSVDQLRNWGGGAEHLIAEKWLWVSKFDEKTQE